jgi:hypothetical protein
MRKRARIAMHRKLGQSVPTKFHISMMPMKMPMTCMPVWVRPAGAGINPKNMMNSADTIIVMILLFDILFSLLS